MNPRSTRIHTELRRRVFETARFRCGYCQISQRVIGPLLEIEHILPEARGGSSVETNLWIACPRCNKHKSDRVEGIDPLTRSVARFFNPRTDHWQEHFEWIEAGAMVQGKTPVGRATVHAFDMNNLDTVTARRLWIAAGWHPPKD